MQPPVRHKSSIVETLSRPIVYGLRYLFFVLIFFLLFSVAAGLFMPGQEYGRYALELEAMQTCAEFESDLAPFNVNAVDFTVGSAVAGEFDSASPGSIVCWLEIAGVSQEGVSPAAAPLYRAARDRAAAVLKEERYYLPRHGRRETQLIWLLSLVLGAVVLVARVRSQNKAAQES